METFERRAKVIYAQLHKKNKKTRNTCKPEKESSRVYTFKYYLKYENQEINVCKVFFLSTFGYEKENDRVLKNVRSTDTNSIAPKPDQRRHPSSKKVDRNVIIQHINSFRPTISHYRREHAPDRKYLPSDVSITLMYKDFKDKYPDTTFSYELYRKVVSGENISFAKLGHEECWECECYGLHKQTENHDNDANCDICQKWKVHKEKATNARKEYQEDAEKPKATDELIISADLQKVK